MTGIEFVAEEIFAECLAASPLPYFGHRRPAGFTRDFGTHVTKQ